MIKKSKNGDLVIARPSMKDTAITTFLMNLARELGLNENNRVKVFETFSKWVNEFDGIPYARAVINPKYRKGFHRG